MTRANEAAGVAAAPRMDFMDHRAMIAAARGFLRHDGFTSSAALAFFFLMSLFPFLIFLASALALLTIPHLAQRMVHLASDFVPAETMPLVESMLSSTMHSNRGMLSVGFVLAVIYASNAFAVMSDALNVIYDVKEKRSFWKGRLSAIAVTGVEGAFSTIALAAMLLGPHFGRELRRVFYVNETFVYLWPVLRYVVAISCALVSIEVLYYLGPSRKQGWREQLPGCVFAVVVWIVSSGILGIYLRQFSYMNAMYGTLTSFIVLMLWLQITAAAILLGAELNAQLERLQHGADQVVRADVPA
jgi:membrane protein